MINTALRTSAILCALLGLSSCGSNSTPPTAPSTPTLVSLTGAVTAQDGAKLAGVTVRIGDGLNAGQSTTTNDHGEYRFEGLAASNGNVSAVADGYDSVITGIYIDGRKPLNFTLRTSVPWSRAGTGNAVFDIPAFITRVRIVGSYTGVRSDFTVQVGECGIVDYALGTGALHDAEGATYPLMTRQEGAYSVVPWRNFLPVANNRVPVKIVDSTGDVSWSITEERVPNASADVCYPPY